MADAQSPILVYDRIQSNRRNTLLLLGVFAVVAFPFVAGLMVWVGTIAGIWSYGGGQFGGIGIFMAFIAVLVIPVCFLSQDGCGGLLSDGVSADLLRAVEAHANYWLPAVMLAVLSLAGAASLQ